MTTAATSLLGLALPVTGELSGTWGDTVNNSITALLDSAVAGTTTLSADADVTLTTTTLAANQAREAIILWTAAGTVTRNITAPAQSKTYVVLNKSSTQSIVIRGVGPTTGVTVLAGKQAMVAWDGADFVEVSSGYVDGPATSTDNAVARFDGTDGKLIQNSVVIIADTTGNMSGVGTLGVGAITTSGALVGAASQDAFNTVSTTLNLGGAATTVNIVAATGTLTVANTTLAAKAVTATSLTNSALTATRLVYSGTAGLEVDSANLTFNGTILTSTGFAGPLNGTVGATTANTGAFTTLTTSSTVTITGGTANGVAYLDGSKVLTTGSALVFDGTSNLNVGGTSVYTSSGRGNLTLGGSASGLLGFQIGGVAKGYVAHFDSNMQIWNDVNSPILFGVNSTEQMRLTSSGLEVKQSQLIGYSSYAGLGSYGLAVAGNVGIGTDTPGAKLDVVGAARVSGVSGTGYQSLRLYGTGTAYNYMQIDNTGGVINFGVENSSGGSLVTGTSAYATVLSSYSNTPIQFGTNNTLRMTLTAAGNLLIGQTVTKTDEVLRVASAGQASMLLDNTGKTNGACVGVFNDAALFGINRNPSTGVFYNASNYAADIVLVGNSSTSYISFETAAVANTIPTERARITSDGDLLVGTTNLTFSSGGIRLYANNSLEVVRDGASNQANVYLNKISNDGEIVSFNRAGTQVGNISVTTLLTTYNTTSDYRLKTVIGAVADSGSRIDALQPVEYEWKANGSRTRGFLAHQFQEVYASSVTGTKDAVDADGKPVYQAMQASTPEVIADLVAEIQSLRKRLAAAGI